MEWKLSEEADAAAPLGTITIEDDDGNVIEQEATYLDDWFAALLDGVRELRAGVEETLVVIEEQPDPIELSAEEGMVTMSWDAAIVVVPLDDLIASVRGEALRFVETMSEYEGAASNPTLTRVRSMASRLR